MFANSNHKSCVIIAVDRNTEGLNVTFNNQSAARCAVLSNMQSECNLYSHILCKYIYACHDNFVHAIRGTETGRIQYHKRYCSRKLHACCWLYHQYAIALFSAANLTRICVGKTLKWHLFLESKLRWSKDYINVIVIGSTRQQIRSPGLDAGGLSINQTFQDFNASVIKDSNMLPSHQTTVPCK